MLFPGVGSVAKNCYKGRAQRKLLARLLLKASQPPAVQQRVASTPQPSKEQGEEPFCGEPPLTLHVGRTTWLFSSEVALWIPQRKQFATLNSSEAQLGHLLCRLHDPHFFPNMTVVRAMTKEEEEQHRAIMSQVAQEREPENEKEKEQAKAQGPTDGGAGEQQGGGQRPGGRLDQTGTRGVRPVRVTSACADGERGGAGVRGERGDPQQNHSTDCLHFFRCAPAF
ncbi:hypothetical protein QOT17_022607 [Balamuthia mandrillaris]